MTGGLRAGRFWIRNKGMNGSYQDPESALDRIFEQIADQIEGLKGDDRAAFDDFEFYTRYVMGYGNPDFAENSRVIKQICYTLQYEPQYQDVLIICPRGSAKSKTVTTNWTTWCIGRNPLVRFLLTVSKQDLGEAFGREFDQVLKFNERYRRIFGDLVPPLAEQEKWTTTDKIVRRPTPPGGMKDPTLGIVSVGSNVPSRRSDQMILDDIVTEQNAYTKEQRAKLEDFVFRTLFPILVPGGRRIVVGTRWDPRDFYAKYAERIGVDFPAVPSINLTVGPKEIEVHE